MDIEVKEFLTKTLEALYKMADNESISDNWSDISLFIRTDLKTCFNDIMNNVRQDAKEADFFNNIDRGKIDPLVRTAFNVAFNYETVMYAKKIIEKFNLPLNN